MKNTSILFLYLFLAGVLLLAACGKKGALFIPDEQSIEQSSSRAGHKTPQRRR